MGKGKLEDVEITSAEINRHSVRLKLQNGVEIHLSSNPGYLHLSLSFVDDVDPVKAAANIANINYTERAKD